MAVINTVELEFLQHQIAITCCDFITLNGKVALYIVILVLLSNDSDTQIDLP